MLAAGPLWYQREQGWDPGFTERLEFAEKSKRKNRRS